jgi:hypothetical protein
MSPLRLEVAPAFASFCLSFGDPPFFAVGNKVAVSLCSAQDTRFLHLLAEALQQLCLGLPRSQYNCCQRNSPPPLQDRDKVIE